jgi:nucleotide-binding universal stress UspA family protein
MKILMATDGSPEATTALRTASRLLRKGDRRADVLCVAPEFRPPQGKGKASAKKVERLRAEYRRQILRETSKITDQAQAMLGREGITARAVTEIGSPADVILRLADEYDVTVIGAKGKHEESKLGLGPVASRIIQHASGTVLIARGEMPEKRLRILAGVDGSLASQRALQVMTSYFNVDEAEVTLMHVAETPWVHLGLEREWFSYPEDMPGEDPAMDMEREMRLEAEEVIEAARDQLADFPLSVVVNISEGNAGTELLGEAEKDEYDLIVIGATGISDIKHSLLGSVSTKVAWHAPCSVVVVRGS